MRAWTRSLSLAAIVAAVPSLALSQDDTHDFFSLSATGGVAVMALPGLDNIVVSGPGAPSNGNVLATGGTVGLSFGTGIGTIGDYNAFFGGSAFGTYVSSSATTTKTFSGMGLLVVPGFSTPGNGSITLNTSRTAGTATVSGSVSNTNPQGGTGTQAVSGNTVVSGSAGSGSGVNATATGNSFVFGGGNTQVTSTGSALAYGAIADTSGSIFIAVGDLSGLAVTSSSSQSAFYSGIDLTVGASGQASGQTVVQGYVGPSYRYMGQGSTSTVSIDIPEIAATTVVHPLYTLNRDVNMYTHYFGGVAGIGFSTPVSEGVTFSLGAEGSVYVTQTNASGNESVTISGGSGVAGLPVATQTVNQSGGSASSTGMAYAVRAQSAVTFALSEKLALTLGGTADYLSSVARGGNADVAYTASGANANASWSSGSNGAVLSFGDMWSFTGTASLTGNF